MQDVLDVYLGRGWEKRLTDAEYWKRIQDIPNSHLWRVKNNLKFNLVNYFRESITSQWVKYGESKALREDLLARINPAALMIGFARRFAPYKRAALIFSDLDRLDRIVSHEKRPVHIIFGGKSHPSDGAGMELIKQVVHLCNDKRFIGKIFFLEDYDLSTAGELIRGVDVWLNVPRRPYEACGTSGQKIIINGGLNLSVSDGWWCEGFDGTNGWNVGPVRSRFEGYENDAEADAADGESLYSLLEDVVAPMFYERDASGIPQEWMNMVKRSIMTIVPRFNAERMVNQYAQDMYIPAARRGRDISADSFKLAKELADWKLKVPMRFSSLKLVEVEFVGIHGDSLLVGKPFSVHVRIDPGKMEKEEIQAELIIGKMDRQEFIRDPERIPLRLAQKLEQSMLTFTCEHQVQESGQYAYGIRIVPFNVNLTALQDLGLALWG
jgi:phosphorylase/glycogen(starch) synthase